ncbi:kinesin-like protein KIF20A isoform X1 [Esox lucius]|uniref:Kinesin-like protein n=1 Tax=Esox lucius TaxID=8010 RepID=A0A3P8Z3H2_ESOLU|nr:kinesin-like protein KIF20A isoform X1 [Esox lucius]
MTTIIDLTQDCTVFVHADAMESTCNDLHSCNPHRDVLSELSSITSTQSEVLDTVEQQPQQLRVYLRVRPFSKDELSNNEDQGCVVLENSQTVVLNAPKGSATMKSSEKGIGQAIHKFSFSQIFGPETKQADLFEATMKSQVCDYLEGKNALIFSYGVTNAGKTHTIQGSHKDPGILPRTLDVIFRHINGRQYENMDLKPYLGGDAQYLGPDQVKQERCTKATVFALLKEEHEPPRVSGVSSDLFRASTGSLSFSVSYDNTDNTVEFVNASSGERDRTQFAMWVAFYEIYNESVYDLLQAPTTSKTKRRPALRVCEDSVGDSYVRDLKWINVHNSEEACKILRVGNKNRSAASTKLNHSSSRSHSIFTMKLLSIDGTEVQRMSEFSLCDLAGSERCGKTKTFGERLKEAGNINNSLLILGKCIAALRKNQSDRMKNSYIPFRESKLTRLFQSIFCGKGRASMIVNINQCASTYDETLHVMKFSAVAKQVIQVIPTKLQESFTPRLMGRDGKPLLRNGVIDDVALENYLSEEELLDDEDENDMSILPQEDLLNVVENLRTKLLAERRKNLVQEIEIRKEMGDAMLQQLMESEELRNRQVAKLKDSYQEKLENTFDLYKDALKDHAYQRALERVEDDYVPLDEFIAEQEKVEALEQKLSEMKQIMSGSTVGSSTVPTKDNSSQTESISPVNVDNGVTDAERCKILLEEKSALKKLCEQKEELIVLLEKKFVILNDTLQEAGERYHEKTSETETLQKRLADQTQDLERIAQDCREKDKELVLLKEELVKLSQKSPILSKPKRGFMANIRDSVTSPRTSTIGRTLRKSVRTEPLLKKKPFH